MKTVGNNVTAALLLAGSAFFLQGCSAGGTVKRNVVIEGVEVGGLPYAEAEERVRAKIAEDLPPLVVRTPAGEFPVKLSFSDNVSELVRGAKKGESLSADVKREWVGEEEELEEICVANARTAVDAQLSFSADGFSYSPETDGIACDYRKLLSDVTDALSEDITEITLVCREYKPAVTEESLRARTRLLSSYTTYFDGDNEPRVTNIRLSASRVSGTLIGPNGEFSFNAAVGKRTEENGYRLAAVIQDGQFAQGVGGGVCQTSTTLFNAALRAGMTITESRNHSLAVSYVPPSLDAMVSEYSDLKFRNPYDLPVYILSRVQGEGVTFEFYGLPDGYRYETESKVLMRLPPPAPQIVEGEREEVIRAEKEGLASESYLLTYDGEGTLLSRKRIRKDSYAAVQGIYQVVPEDPVPPEGENADE